FLIFARGAALATFAALDAWLVRVESVVGSVARATAHVFGHQTPDVTAAMGALLAFDAVAAAAIFGLYAAIRARRVSVVESDPC
ncbi:MAG: hypothetical protein IAI49_16885, partial [Candidatus Eremiobacteraeota bacterium]|nr:hypothetical protein [Candidatus Eremiobacteraeota bacterium]